jgi:hypothetical protein
MEGSLELSDGCVRCVFVQSSSWHWCEPKVSIQLVAVQQLTAAPAVLMSLTAIAGVVCVTACRSCSVARSTL